MCIANKAGTKIKLRLEFLEVHGQAQRLEHLLNSAVRGKDSWDIFIAARKIQLCILEHLCYNEIDIKHNQH
jgi:hypothetical protein